ncbi:MAG: ADP-ribosylation factor GTPase-activating protein 1 [Marteilia pararefringens]
MIDVSNLSDDEDLISKIQVISDKYIDLDAYGGFTLITDSYEYRQKKFFEIKFNALTISKTQHFSESSIKLDIALLTINEDENEKAIIITDEVSNKYHFEFDTVREAKMFNDAITASKKSISSKAIHYALDGSVSVTLQALKDAFMRNGNDQCFECQAFGPEWSNPVIGITICVECSKYHRKMGLPMGLAKGLWLDKWK